MLYHGTKIPPSRILYEGLKPANIKQMLDTVTAKYSIPKQLRHIFDNKIQDYIQRKQKHMFVYLTENIGDAIRYAQYGSNFMGLLEIEACELVEVIWKPNKDGYLYFVNLKGSGEVKLPYIHPKLIIGWAKLIFNQTEGEYHD